MKHSIHLTPDEVREYITKGMKSTGALSPTFVMETITVSGDSSAEVVGTIPPPKPRGPRKKKAAAAATPPPASAPDASTAV